MALAATTFACSAGEEDTASSDDEGALKEANSEWAELSGAFRSALDSDARTRTSTGGGLHTQSDEPGRISFRDLGFCSVIRHFPDGVTSETPRPFVFFGGNLNLQVVGGAGPQAEVAWDVYHNQVAVFRGHSLQVGGGAGVGGGLYGGIGFQDVPRARKVDALGENVIENWPGPGYSVGISRDVGPLLSLGIEVFGDPQLTLVGVTLSVNGGFNFLPDNLPAALEKAIAVQVYGTYSKVVPSPELTEYAEKFLTNGPLKIPFHVAQGTYEDKQYPYIQFDGSSSGATGFHGRDSLTTSLSIAKLNPSIADVAGPIALAIGVIRDLKERGVDAAEMCRKQRADEHVDDAAGRR